MVNNTVYQFVDSNLGFEMFLKEKEHQKKGALKSVHFKLGIQENFTYVSAKILENGAKFMRKLTSDFKNHMRNLGNFRQVVESP